MDKDILDIVDTAVKIGLGALISGVSTYLVTSKNHSNESKKEILNRRLNIIEAAAELTNEYINSFQNLLSVIDGVRKLNPNIEKLSPDRDSETWKYLREYDEKFCDSRDHAQNAISKLNLIGLSVVSESFVDFSELDKEVRDMVMFKKTIPDRELILEWQKRIKEKATYFYSSLGSHYKA